ncbi:MAG: phage tail tube protein [Pseudomonadota bacterium]
MPNVSLWSNVQIAVQSALSNAQAVSAVTKANPAVATYVGTDMTNGDYLYLSSVQGMYQLDEKVVRAANVNSGGNTVELEGLDSALFDTFSSGNLQVVTFGSSLQIALDLSASGGDFEQIDITTIHDRVRKQIPGAANPIVYSGNCIWDVADAGFLALKAASDLKAKRAIRMTFANNQKVVFTGYIGFTGLPTGSNQDKVQTPFQITMFGTPTYYAS